MNSEKLVTLEVNSIHPTALKQANTIQKKSMNYCSIVLQLAKPSILFCFAYFVTISINVSRINMGMWH